MTHKIHFQNFFIVLLLLGCFASSGLAQSVVPLREDFKELIAKDWKSSTQTIQDNDFVVYAAPDQSAFFALTAFERQYNPEFILEEFLKNMQSQMPQCSFEKINTLKKNAFYQAQGKSAGVAITVAAIQQGDRVVLAYTLSTPKTPHQALLQAMVTSIEIP